MSRSTDCSFDILVELVTQEPTLLGCLRILQGTCLSQGIKCVIKDTPASPEFAEFVTLHYSSFCENAIRSMYTCGFVPWRLRKIPGGDVVPEVLPVGSFEWTVEPNRAQSRSTNKTKNAGTMQQRQAKALKKQKTALHMSDTASLVYKLKLRDELSFTEEDVEIYEHSQPRHNSSFSSISQQDISSPLSHVMVDYRMLRQAQFRHSRADAWNTQAKMVCGYNPPSDPYRVNEGNAITNDWGFPQNRSAMTSDVNMSTDPEYNVHARDRITETVVGQKKTEHPPLIYSLPQNTTIQSVANLQPIQDIDALNMRLSKNISSILGIPFELISGGYNGSGAVGRSVQNTRVFATNMLSLCRHLQELLRCVYAAAYGGQHQDVTFTLRPSPRICLESVDDLVKLLGTGVVSCTEASHISDMLLGIELQDNHSGGTKDTTMYRTPEQALAELNAKTALLVAKQKPVEKSPEHPKPDPEAKIPQATDQKQEPDSQPKSKKTKPNSEAKSEPIVKSKKL